MPSIVRLAKRGQAVAVLDAHAAAERVPVTGTGIAGGRDQRRAGDGRDVARDAQRSTGSRRGWA